MSEAGIKFLMNNEGNILHPYLDVKGIPTIGVGCTYYEDGTKVTMQDPAITPLRSIELFKYVLKHYELTVYSNTRDDINQNQFDSLTSLCYNIGVSAFKNSTLVKRINARASDELIKTAFLMWRKPASIVPRRKREMNLYFK